MKKQIVLLLTVTVLIALPSCKSKETVETSRYERPLPPGQLALRKITDPTEIPDFTVAANNLTDLRQGIANSLNYLAKPSSQQFYPYAQITHAHAVASLQAFADLIDAGLTGSALNTAVREKFDTYMSVGCDMQGTVLFTGYYTPIFNGSLEPSDRFKYPLYKQPTDLEKAPDGAILGRKLPNGQYARYPSRAQIEKSKMLVGQELVWLSDPFEAYIANVQGSAKLRLPDGSITTVGYAANNGHNYKPIAQKLIEDRKISADQMSLDAMISYFKRNPKDIEHYTHENPRYVFFRLDPGSQPHGSINEPVIPYRSIATDKSIFPRASLTFIDTQLPELAGLQIANKPYQGFALDQDTGGAIRAPGRCDVYIGQGRLAGKLAGQTCREGKLYYLFLKTPPTALAPTPPAPTTTPTTPEPAPENK